MPDRVGSRLARLVQALAYPGIADRSTKDHSERVGPARGVVRIGAP